MAQNPPSEYVPTNGQPAQPVPPPQQFLPPTPAQPPAPQYAQPPAPQYAQPPAPQYAQPAAPQFPGGGSAEAPYRAYVPTSRKRNWTLAIIWTVGLVIAIPALFLFIGIFSWAIGIGR